MAIFKAKKSAEANKALDKVQATVVAAKSGPDPETRQTVYNVVIEGHMAELINEDVNEIAISVESRADDRAPGKSLESINKFLEKQKSTSKTPTKTQVTTVDPKQNISHENLSVIQSPGIKKALNGSSSKDAITKVKDNYVRTKVTYEEKPIVDFFERDKLDPIEVEQRVTPFDRFRESVPTNRTLNSGIMDLHNENASLGRMFNSDTDHPKIKSQSSKIMPVLTKRVIPIACSVGQRPRVDLLNTNGVIIGQVKQKSSGVIAEAVHTPPLENVSFFNLLSRQKKLFDISIIKQHNYTYLSISCPYKETFSGYCLYVRQLSKTPSMDRHIFLGEFSHQAALKIRVTIDWSKKHMFYAIPISRSGDKISYSEMYLHDGIVSEYDVSVVAMQLLNTVHFYFDNLPHDADVMFVTRTNDLSGQQVDLPQRILKIGKNKRALDQSTGKNEFVYSDPTIGDLNQTYSYDFFVRNKIGMLKHLFRKSIRTFEKNIDGSKIASVSLRTNSSGVDVINARIIYEDAFVPKNTNYSLYNPDDDFFEACRNRKRVVLLGLKRHSSFGQTDDLGIHVLNPGELNTLEAQITNNKEFAVEIFISSKFLRENNVQPTYNSSADYYYELRIGSYLLSNELSFLKNPIKLNVPNEFTDGKTEYQYHPIVHESPLRSDRGLHGRLFSSKKDFLLESLNSKSRMLRKRGKIKKVLNTNLDVKLVSTNKNSESFAIKVQALIDKVTLDRCDHCELYVGNTTSGTYVPIGKFKLVNPNFYFLDTYSAKIASNKLKYVLIGRDMEFKNIFTFKSDMVDISKTNMRSEKDIKANLNEATFAKQAKIRGL